MDNQLDIREADEQNGDIYKAIVIFTLSNCLHMFCN